MSMKKEIKDKIRIRCWSCNHLFVKTINRLGKHKHQCPKCKLFGHIVIESHKETKITIYHNIPGDTSYKMAHQI